ncbi:hypothetical protein DH2020_011408 [Rehmannia glutinosa]|uniref:BHLH domain-containing protein n=1 Tax=Rehmannia glutinosa TaxID=99300 RepID=A0ABR0XDJ4_REHGL
MEKRGCSSTPRIERKIIEKNRRNRMKSLYSNLISLLPNNTSKLEGLPLPDQIDEAVEYIKSLKMKLENIRQKKSLLPRKRLNSCINEATKKWTPLVEVQHMGPNIDVILANGLHDYSKFHDIVTLLYHHGVEISSASFSRDGNSIIQVGESKLGFGGATVTRKLKELVCGTSKSEAFEPGLNLWDYDIESNIWGFEMHGVLPSGK